MGKGDRRNRKKAPPGCELPQMRTVATIPAAGVPQRGRPKRDDITALDARCRKLGIPISTEARAVVRAQLFQHDIGFCIHRTSATADEAARIWASWAGLTGAMDTYSKRIIGQNGSPKNAVIAVLSEKIEADTAPTVDLRDADEKDRDAIANMARWQAYLRRLAQPHRVALLQVVAGMAPPLWADKAPTKFGLIAAAAVASLADIAGEGLQRRLTNYANLQKSE